MSFGGLSMGDTQASQGIMGAGGDAKKPRTEEKMSVLPVTVRAIEKALAKKGDGEVTFYGSEPGMLITIAVVESVTVEGATTEFVLNDSTGRIRARHYAADAESQLKCVEAGRYVQVAGQLRTSPAPHISVTNARMVRSADEISYHMIESAHAALRLLRGGPVEPATPIPKKPEPVPMDVTPSKETAVPSTFSASPPATFTSQAEMQSKPPAPVAAAVPEAKAALAGEALRSAIVGVLQKSGEGREEGVPIAEICTALLPSTEAAIRAELAALIDIGDAFSTIDDDHFSLF